MLIIPLLVLSIGFVQYVMELLVDVLNLLNEAICLVSFGLDMSWICLSHYKWYGYINWTHWLASQAHLKMVMASRDVESLVVAVLDIGDPLIPCAWIF